MAKYGKSLLEEIYDLSGSFWLDENRTIIEIFMTAEEELKSYCSEYHF